MGAATVMRIGADYPDLARAIVMLDPLLGRIGPAPTPTVGSGGNGGAAPARRPNMFGDPAGLVAGNNQSFDELVAHGHRDNPKWDIVDLQFWALSKKQYHGPYSAAQGQALFGTMSIGDSLAKITAPALILKADASPEVRKTNEEMAKVMQHGKLVHIDGAAHNLHHDNLERTVQVLTEFLSSL
jgi:pimeloyl-ACP methyl ester carboxylesterase